MVSLSRAEAFAVCHTCRVRHPCVRFQEYLDFTVNHDGHAVSYLHRDAIAAKGAHRLAAWDPRKQVVSAFGEVQARMLRQAVGELTAYAPNSNIKQAFGTTVTLTSTNLQSLANDATKAWESPPVDNSSNLYLDDLFQFTLNFANTAPAANKCALVFAAHSIDGGTTYTSPATGAEGLLTSLPDITINPQAAPRLGYVPYTTQNETVKSRAMSMAATGGGVLPDHYAALLTDVSGAALEASGNIVKHTPVFATVV